MLLRINRSYFFGKTHNTHWLAASEFGHRIIKMSSLEESTGKSSLEEPTGKSLLEESTGQSSSEEPMGKSPLEEPTGKASLEEPTGKSSLEEPTEAYSLEVIYPSEGISSLEELKGMEFDAVIIPGGGINHGPHTLREYVQSRLDAAYELDDKTRYYMVLSRGTPHTAPVRDMYGWGLDESDISARYLYEKGVVDRSRILIDNWSLDTIGNAFFARQMLAEPMGLRKLCIINSKFHMERTQEVFNWVFNLPKGSGETAEQNGAKYELYFFATENTELSETQVLARRDKEVDSLELFRTKTAKNYTNMSQLARFMFTEHMAYACEGMMERHWPTKPTEFTEKEIRTMIARNMATAALREAAAKKEAELLAAAEEEAELLAAAEEEAEARHGRAAYDEGLNGTY